MVGADGLTTWYTDGTNAASATWTRARGGTGLSTSGPAALGWWLVGTKLDRNTTDLARFSWVSGGTSAAQGDEVFSLVNGEVRREVLSEGSVGRVYLTGRLELPADPRDGSTWSSTGYLVAVVKGKLGDVVAYTSQGSAAKPSEADLASAGCLDVTVDETSQDVVATSARTWCPSKGIVRFAHGSQTFTVGDAPAVTVPVTASAFPWDRAGSAMTSTMSLTPAGVQLIPSFMTRPGVLASGRLVGALKQANDVVAIDPEKTTSELDGSVWRAHPGGVIQTCVTLGELTVVTTSERRAVAYGPTGVTAWTASLPDTASTPAVEFGGNVVIATVNGTVQALSATTGLPVWRASMPSVLQVRPTVGADVLVAADETGTLVAFGTDGHELWRTTDLPIDSFAVSSGVLVTAERGAATLRGYDVATGTKLWRTWEPALVHSLNDLDGVVAAYTTGGVKAFEPSTGSLLWFSQETLIDATVVGDRVLVVTPDSVLAIDRDGHESARWLHGLSKLPALTVWVAAGPDRLVAVTSSQLFRGIVA
jgi:outer membrane protein assembly factor BamB